MEWVPASRKGIWQSMVIESGSDSNKICKWYGDYLHGTAMHVFDEWSTESHLAASALASFLQDLVVVSNAQKNVGACIASQSNVNAFVLLPIPSEHYHVCGKTSECRLRCADAFAMFDFELKRSLQLGYHDDHSANAPFQSFDVSVESPFFNPYQASSTVNYIEDRILAVSSRNLSSSYACSTCPSECVVVAKTQWEAIASVSVVTYCTPPPSNLMATIYAADGGSQWSFKAPSVSKTMTLTYCNFALQVDEMYILLGYTSASMSITSSGILSFNPEQSASVITQQKLFAMRSVSDDRTAQKTESLLLLDTDSLTSSILSPAVHDYIFGKVCISLSKIHILFFFAVLLCPMPDLLNKKKVLS